MPALITLFLVSLFWVVPILQTGVEDEAGRVKGQQGGEPTH
ncbi:MAG TPA: hypothetical protein VJR89_30715 [Polyangiales bacterium]|nr:hypothetical protein [Polyangiales bacterium]